MAEPAPNITPPPPLPPPIIGTDVPGSAPGIPQPVIATGGESLPPSFPLPPAGTWLPPPLIGEGENELAPVPVVPPGTGPGIAQPVFKTGSPTFPASLFPEFTTTPPYPPIVFANIQMIGDTVPPSTPGQNPPPITISDVPTIPQLPSPPIPVNTPPLWPVISGTPEVGAVLTVSTGTWSNRPTSFAYHWFAHGSYPTPVSTQNTYIPVEIDVGTYVSAEVAATNAAGQSAFSSAADWFGPIVADVGPPPTNTALPVITGALVVGDQLTCSTGTWTGSPTFAHQWLRDGTNIGGDSATYTLVAADDGAMIGCTVNGTNSGGEVSASAAAVGPISATADEPEQSAARAVPARATPNRRKR